MKSIRSLLIASVVIFCVGHAGWAFAQVVSGSPGRSQPDDLSSIIPDVEPGPVSEGFTGLVQMTQKLNWNDEARSLESALDTIWKQNNWNDESDQFAYQLTRDVSKIPPWDFMQRFEVATDRVADRYGLAESDRGKFKGTVLREAGSFFMKNAPLILSHSSEMVQTRLNGQPFTAEQVARWSREGQNLMPEVREMVMRVVGEVKPLVPSDRKEIIERDMASFDRRRQHILKMGARWMNNEWKPEDWGLQNDPIHRAALANATAQAAVSDAAKSVAIAKPTEPAPPPIPTRWVAHKPPTWIAYVEDFRKKYNLDAGQIAAVESIHAELLLRANDYLEQHKEKLLPIPEDKRDADPGFEPIKQWFKELQERLDAVPTSLQRDSKRP